MTSADKSATKDSKVSQESSRQEALLTEITGIGACVPACDRTDLIVKLLNKDAVLPVRKHPDDAGVDISSVENVTISAHGRATIGTGLAIKTPAGYYGQLFSRSGLASKNGLNVGAGVVDANYRGEIKVVLFNHDSKDYDVKIGDRIAQLILIPVAYAGIVKVESLDDTDRSAGGFGSTGK